MAILEDETEEATLTNEDEAGSGSDASSSSRRLRLESEASSDGGALDHIEPLQLDDLKSFYETNK